jgi:hypothetical protein
MMRTAHVAAGFGRFLLRNSHGSTLFFLYVSFFEFRALLRLPG